MAGEIGSWLSGPEPLGPKSGYPGEQLGLPQAGPGSLARMGRRLGALVVDWLIAYGLAGLGLSLGLVSMPFGFTPGQYLLGLQVASVDKRLHVGTGRAIARGLLIGLVIPALFTDADGRGFQDRLTATAVVFR